MNLLYMQYLQTAAHIGAIGLLIFGVGGFLFSNMPAVGTGLKRAFSGWFNGATATTTADTTDDVADFQALSRIQHRFARLKCPEGQAAVQTCMTHFFHGIEGQP